jgi:1-acyl-sn-glycerol-3-phosphate acyltransferase
VQGTARADPGAANRLLPMIRCVFVILAFITMTLVLLPFQLIGIALRLPMQRGIPYLYHRILRALMGVRIHEIGKRSTDFPLLILANHASWLDIVVITSLTPAVFVAKKEVAGWPIFGWLAKLQRTVFIDRERRHRTGAATQEIAERLIGGDAVVLFAEGTSSDGNRILPFRSALIGAVHHAIGSSTHHERVTVQPLSLAYVNLNGLPLGRAFRSRVAWYGDADLIPHLVGVCAAGAVDVTVSWGEPASYDMSADRKDIARVAEQAVRTMTAQGRRMARPAQVTGETIAIAPPATASA